MISITLTDASEQSFKVPEKQSMKVPEIQSKKTIDLNTIVKDFHSYKNICHMVGHEISEVYKGDVADCDSPTVHFDFLPYMIAV